MQHVVSISGGTASAVCADRVLKRHPKSSVTLWFADTLWEDDDLYRFLNELEMYWEHPIIRESEGRNPLQVAEDRQIIPNQRIAPCSMVLKQQLFKKYLDSLTKPVTAHLGLDWTEEHRMARPRAEYESISGVSVDYPLTWQPIPFGNYYNQVSSWGVKPPRLYEMGFPHNNCGGRCVRQGVKEWLRLKLYFPERFAEVRDWEAQQRAKGGARADYAITRDQRGGEVKPLPLADLERNHEAYGTPNAKSFTGDAFSCFCDV